MSDYLTPIKAIRAKCIDCCAGQKNEVKLCPATDCGLHPYRLGHNPNRKPRQLSDEQRAVMAERLASARLTKNSIVE